MQFQYGPGVSEDILNCFQESLFENKKITLTHKYGLKLFQCSREQVFQLAKIHPPVLLQMRSFVLEDVELLRMVLPLWSSVEMSYSGLTLYQKLPEHIKERNDILMAVPWKDTSTNYISEKIWMDTDKFANIIWNCIAVASHLKIPSGVDVLDYFNRLLKSVEDLENLNGCAHHYPDNKERKAFQTIYFLYRVLPQEYRQDIQIFDIFYNKIKDLRAKSWNVPVLYGGEVIAEDILLLNADGDLLCQKQYFEKYLTDKSMLVKATNRFYSYELFKNEKFHDLVKFILEEDPELYILTRAYALYDEEHLFQNMDKYATDIAISISIMEYMENKNVSKEFVLKYALYNPGDVLETFTNSGKWNRWWNNKMDFFYDILNSVPKNKLSGLRFISNFNTENMEDVSVKELIQKYPEIYPCLHSHYRSDREITQIAIDKLPSNKESVGKIYFLSDEDVLVEGDNEIRLNVSIEYSRDMAHWFTKEVLENNFNLYKRRASFFYSFENLPFIKEAMKKDRDWAYKMISDGEFPKDIREFFSEDDLRDVEFVKKIMAINSKCYEFLDKETQENEEIINVMEEIFFCREKTVLENRPDLLNEKHITRLMFYTFGDMGKVFKKLKGNKLVSEQLLKDVFYREDTQNKPVLVNASYQLFQKNIFANIDDIEIIINSLDRHDLYREVFKEIPLEFIKDEAKLFPFLEKYQDRCVNVNLAYFLWNESFFDCWNKECENISFEFASKDGSLISKILSRFEEMKMREDLMNEEKKAVKVSSVKEGKVGLRKF